MTMRAAAALLLAIPASVPVAAADSPRASRVLNELSQPSSFAYGDFQDHFAVESGVLTIRADRSRGGIGFLTNVDLSEFSQHSPALSLRTGPTNEARQLKLLVADNRGGRRLFTYELPELGGETLTQVLPVDALPLDHAVADPGQAALDVRRITQHQIQGDWSSDPVDVAIERIELLPPTPEMRARRQAYAKRLAARRERLRREAAERAAERERLLAAAPHPEDGPVVERVGPVAADILGVTIQAGRFVPSAQLAYQAQPGDRIETKGEPVLAWQEGRIVEAAKDRFVTREDSGARRRKTLGALVGDGERIWPEPLIAGQPLTEVTAGEPRAYQIVSTEDPAYARPVTPAAVYRKSKPTQQAGGQMPVRHTVYLKLPEPLCEGSRYTIRFAGVNTREADVTYGHQPRRVRSEAVHVSQIGFRPDDPLKCAFLSLWMGTGGAVDYAAGEFHLLETGSGHSVYQGDVQRVLAADQPEQLKEAKNYTGTHVDRMDFSDFTRAGEYRVYVPGVGVSAPFRIADDVWEQAFRVSMQGILAHRSGIALGPPLLDYVRPRPMHPEDGVQIFEVDVSYWDGESDAIRSSLRRQLGPDREASRLQTHPDAWGGYMDAGDWDRRSQHLMVSYRHLELMDLFPESFDRMRLRLPRDEAENGLPDLVDEALWNLDLYRRLQRPDGGVGGGVESTAHPRAGECSWQESLLIGTFAPDPETSFRYAACAAKAARLLESRDPTLAAGYRESGIRAWNWARAHADDAIRAAVDRGAKRADGLQDAVASMQALAAAELYRLTGQPAYEDARREASVLTRGGSPETQLDALFACALLPDRLADGGLKRQAIAELVKLADAALEFAEGNAFGLTTHVPGLPVIGYVGYYSVPEMVTGPVLPRVHYLTGDDKYLAGAIAAAQFSAGANPMNLTLTKGVGWDYPRAPLHIDSRHSGQEPPDGITVYGPSDPSLQQSWADWAHTWYLSKSMVPDSREWPAAESYVDLSNWPAMTEYTVHQTLGPTSYYWGYLAAR